MRCTDMQIFFFFIVFGGLEALLCIFSCAVPQRTAPYSEVTIPYGSPSSWDCTFTVCVTTNEPPLLPEATPTPCEPPLLPKSHHYSRC